MAGGGELHITLSGEAAEELRHALPKGALLNQTAEKILRDWAHNRAMEREAKRLEKISKQTARPWREVFADIDKNRA